MTCISQGKINRIITAEVVDARKSLDVHFLSSVANKVRKEGHLIILPTETVYGIAANAYDQNGILRIFEAKNRPMDDPLICHVQDAHNARKLCELNCQEAAIFDVLAEKFWPGPLTICVRADKSVHSIVRAQSDFVAIRCPAHPIAQQILAATRVPLVAPSANLFGQISPTEVSHVLKYFSTIEFKEYTTQEKLYIFDAGPCHIGVESTVISLCYNAEAEKVQLSLLRKGKIIAADICACLEKHCLITAFMFAPNQNEIPAMSSSPGMSLRHYSPVKPAYILHIPDDKIESLHSLQNLYFELPDNKIHLNIKDCIVLDVFNRYEVLENLCKNYLRISDSNNFNQNNALAVVSHNLFRKLHLADEIAKNGVAKAILITGMQDPEMQDERAQCIYDRLFRAASGKKVHMIDT